MLGDEVCLVYTAWAQDQGVVNACTGEVASPRCEATGVVDLVATIIATRHAAIAEARRTLVGMD